MKDMKLVIALCIIFTFLIIPSVFAQEVRLEAKTNMELYQENDIIVEGIIKSVTINENKTSEYFVNVETVLKGDKFSTLTVYGRGTDEIKSSIDKVFQIDEQVLLFLNEDDKKLNVSPYSTVISDDGDSRFFKIPPLKLDQMNVPYEEIFCKSDFVLIKKINEQPACVKSSSVQKLKDRGWAQ